jgi:hypothetical protein
MSDKPEILPNDAVLSDDAEPVTDFTDDDTGDPENKDDLDDLTPEELTVLKLMLKNAKADDPKSFSPDEVN